MLKFWNFTKHTISLVMLLGVITLAIVAKVNLDPVAIDPVTPRVAGADTGGIAVSQLLPLEISDNQPQEPRLITQLLKVDKANYRYLAYFSAHKSSWIESEFVNVSNPNPVPVQLLLTAKVPDQWQNILKVVFTKAESTIETNLIQPGVMSVVIPAETSINVPISYYFTQPVNSKLEIEVVIEILEM